MREQAELDVLGRWRLLTWELSILSSALLLSFLPARRKEQGEDRKPAFCLSLQQTFWGALVAVVGPAECEGRWPGIHWGGSCLFGGSSCGEMLLAGFPRRRKTELKA